jgi:hypothetical protein
MQIKIDVPDCFQVHNPQEWVDFVLKCIEDGVEPGELDQETVESKQNRIDELENAIEESCELTVAKEMKEALKEVVEL